jgi:hypothetical protein
MPLKWTLFGMGINFQRGLEMPNPNIDELEGTTLKVYSYVVKQDKPVGTRDVMRGAELSSPSVAFRHLQKLETMGLLQRNAYGEYIIKEKTSIRGYVWIGKNLIPRMLFYSLIFMVILIVEIVVLAIHFGVENYEFKIFFLYLTLITAVAMVLFLVEGLLVLVRARKSVSASNLLQVT